MKKFINKIFYRLGYEKRDYKINEKLYFKGVHTLLNPLIIGSEIKINDISVSYQYATKVLQQEIQSKILNYIDYEEFKNPFPPYIQIKAKLIIGEKIK